MNFISLPFSPTTFFSTVVFRMYCIRMKMERYESPLSPSPLHPALRVNRIFFSEPCEKTYCSWGATCVVSENGKPLCQCPTDCPSTSEPVCGSDNVTYTNYCHLRKSSCLERKSTRVKNQGACGEYIPFRLFVPIAFQLSKWTDRILVKVRLEGGGGGSRYRVVSPW